MDGKELNVPRRITKETRMVEQFLKQHFPHHPPSYPPAAYQYNSASIRVRIVDECFRKVHLFDRLDLVNPVLRSLPEKTQQKIIIVTLVTPEELDISPSNYEFEHPTPEPRLTLGSRNGQRAGKKRSRQRAKRGASQ
jgi:hypothetical protein